MPRYASLIEADANKGRSIPGAEWRKERDPATASHAVKEYLATLDDAAFGAATGSLRSSSRLPIRPRNGGRELADQVVATGNFEKVVQHHLPFIAPPLELAG